MSGWGLAVAAVVLLALWGLRTARDDSSFFVASRSAGAVLAGLGGTAAGLSAFVFVGGPGLFARLGVASLWIILSAPVTSALQCWTVGERLVESARRHGCLTLPDVIASRFGEGWPRGLAAAAIAIGGTATLAVQIAGCAVIGETLLGIPGWQVAAMAIAATTAYAAAGGMRAGLVAEAVQGAVMATAAVGLSVAALRAAGGTAHAVSVLASRRPDLLDTFGPAGPSSAFGLLLLFGVGTCAQPHYLQKFLLVRERASLRWMPAIMTLALLCVLSVWIGVGLGGTALWLEGAIEVTDPDAIAPALLAGLASPVLRTVALVAVVAAVMSTAASLLNLVAAAVTRDLPRAIGISPAPGLSAPRIATVATALMASAVALTTARPVALLGVLGWGCATASLLPVMTLGLGWRGATRRGVCAAMVLGPAVQLGLEWARTHVRVDVRWEPGLTGAAVGFIVLAAASWLDSRHSEGSTA